ncbi:MAG: barstar family protein [Ruminococcus sp.]|nr:barstar family protein [Ruminococcus sp.]
MKELIINGKEIESKETLHRVFSEGLSFPEWYGNNLDALNDCLTDINEETTVIIEEFGALRDNLGSYADKLKKVLRCVSSENEKITVDYINE